MTRSGSRLAKESAPVGGHATSQDLHDQRHVIPHDARSSSPWTRWSLFPHLSALMIEEVQRRPDKLVLRTRARATTAACCCGQGWARVHGRYVRQLRYLAVIELHLDDGRKREDLAARLRDHPEVKVICRTAPEVTGKALGSGRRRPNRSRIAITCGPTCVRRPRRRSTPITPVWPDRLQARPPAPATWRVEPEVVRPPKESEDRDPAA